MSVCTSIIVSIAVGVLTGWVTSWRVTKHYREQDKKEYERRECYEAAHEYSAYCGDLLSHTILLKNESTCDKKPLMMRIILSEVMMYHNAKAIFGKQENKKYSEYIRKKFHEIDSEVKKELPDYDVIKRLITDLSISELRNEFPDIMKDWNLE